MYGFGVNFVFNLKKTLSAAGFLTRMSGGQIEGLRLLKLLYLADRAAFLDWHRTITGDIPVSMDCGPVLSHIYDLIKYEAGGTHQKAWAMFFSRRNGNWITMLAPTDPDDLAEREVEKLLEAFRSIEGVRTDDLIKLLHERLPEWQNPKGSSTRIEFETILSQEGYKPERIEEIGKEVASISSALSALRVE